MKLFLRLGFLFTATFLAVQLASAITIGQIDTFQTGTTAGWFAGGLGTGGAPPTPPHVVPNGGPAGAGAVAVCPAAGGAAVEVTCWIACRAPVDSCESACS